jgi:anti-anti-sigma regulatory factor
MRTEFELKSFPSGGGQLKVTGDLTVKHSKTFKEHILELLPGKGNYLISLRDVKEVDVSTVQMIWALQKHFINEGRRLIISWPQPESAKQILGRTGVLESIQK